MVVPTTTSAIRQAKTFVFDPDVDNTLQQQAQLIATHGPHVCFNAHDRRQAELRAGMSYDPRQDSLPPANLAKLQRASYSKQNLATMLGFGGVTTADAPRSSTQDTLPSMDRLIGKYPHSQRGLDDIYRCTLCEQPLNTVGDVTAHSASPSHEANVKAKHPMDHSWGVVTADRGVSAAVACLAPSQQIAKSSTASINTEPETEGAAMGRRKKQRYHTAERQEWARACVEKVQCTGTSEMMFSLNDPGKEPTPVDMQTTDLPTCFLSRLLGHGYRTEIPSCNPRYDQNGLQWEHVGREYNALCRNNGIVWANNSGLEEGDDEFRQYRTTPDLYLWDPIGNIGKEHLRL